MGRFKDTFFGFDHDEYYAQLKHMSEPRIREEHKNIRRRVFGAGTQASLGFGAAVATSGISIVVGGIGARRTSVNRQKRKLIEKRMRSMNWAIDDLELKDILIGVGPGLIAAAVAPGAEHVVGHFAGHGASELVSQYAPETLRAAIDTPVQFAHFAEYGVRAQIEAVSHGVVGNASHFVPHTGAEYLATATGYAGASMAEVKAAEHTVKGLAGYGMKKWGRLRKSDSAAKPFNARWVSEQHLERSKLGTSSDISPSSGSNNTSSVKPKNFKSVGPLGATGKSPASTGVLGLVIYNILTMFPIIGHVFGLLWVWSLCIGLLTLTIVKPPKVSPPPVVANLIWLIPGIIFSLSGLKSLWLTTSFVISCIGITEYSSKSPERPQFFTTISFVLLSAAAGFEDKATKELLQVLLLVTGSCSWIFLSLRNANGNSSLVLRVLWVMSFFGACFGVVVGGAALMDLVF